MHGAFLICLGRSKSGAGIILVHIQKQESTTSSCTIQWDHLEETNVFCEVVLIFCLPNKHDVRVEEPALLWRSGKVLAFVSHNLYDKSLNQKCQLEISTTCLAKFGSRRIFGIALWTNYFSWGLFYFFSRNGVCSGIGLICK